MRLYRLAPLAPLALVAACVPRTEVPVPPPPAPAPAPTPTPTPTPAPAVSNWMDAPQTPGDWSYAASSTVTMASFLDASRQARFMLSCEPAKRTIRLIRPGSSGPVPMRVRTETAERVLTAVQIPGDAPSIAASLAAQDPFLDAIAFSKGRFAVETEGQPPLYLPAWPEISRVIEDCR